ncbi:MAG: hypothetical protein ACI89U_001951 [Gammaproteobacteria bacterium]|jgi:hypothetical protein
MEEQDPLAQLKGIHLPDAIGFWPLAPGWWILALTLLAFIIYAVFLVRRRAVNNSYRKLALKQLESLPKVDPLLYLQQVNELLKQTVLVCTPDQNIASLSGRRWLDFLDETFRQKENLFSTGVGSVLATGPYAPKVEYEIDELEQLARQWISKHKITKRQPYAKF